MYNPTKSTLIKIFSLISILILCGFLLVYELTIHEVNQKYKNQQSSQGNISLSTSDLSKDYVSLKGSNPQSGNINLEGNISGNDVQGQTITSTVQNGTSPLNVTSSTLVNNLNADMVDGKHADELTKTTVNNITNTTTGESIQPGTTGQYYRGDKSWQTLNSSAVGLGNVENTALSTWTGSNQVAILGTVTSGTWNAGAINAAGSITGTALQGTSLNLGSGAITSGAINGQTISSSANFTGTITAGGTINGATISGGTLSGGNVSGGTVQGGTLSSTAVNGVTTANILVNTGSYSDPSWLQGLAGSKITGDIQGNASGLTGSPNITVGTITSGNITSSGTLDITGTGDSTVGGNISVNPDFGSELTTNGNFNGSANNWLVSCTDYSSGSTACNTADTPNSVPASGWSYGSNSVSHASGTNNTDALYQDISNTAGETYGSNIITDSNFSLNPATNGWDWMDAGWHWVNNTAMTNAGGAYFGDDLGTSLTAGLYKVQFSTSGMPAGGQLKVALSSGGISEDAAVVSGNGQHTFYFTVGTTPETGGWPYYLYFDSTSVGTTIDNVSAQLVTGAQFGESQTQSYKVSFAVSGMTAGSLSANLGGVGGSPITANGTYTQYLIGKPNANIISFVPSHDAVFTLSNISVTPVQNGTITVQDIITKGGPKVDVRAYGAKGDGKTDNTAAIQAAEDSLPDQGGTLYFPSGTFLGHVTLKSNVHVEGAGINATILKLPNGANTDVIASKDFASLTGNTTNRDGVNRVTLDDITIDGNAGNNTAGYGVRKYGGQWNVHDVVIKNCAQDGVYSEWGSYGGAPLVADSMEDHWTNIMLTVNSGSGMTWNGPHDSVLDNFIVSSNSGNGINFENASGGVANGTQLKNSHIWGNSSTGYGLWIKTSINLDNDIVEGATGTGGIGIYVDSGGAILANGLQVYACETGVYISGVSPGGNNEITGITLSTITKANIVIYSAWSVRITGATISISSNSSSAVGIDLQSGGNAYIDNAVISLGQNSHGINVGSSGSAFTGSMISARIVGYTGSSPTGTMINWANAGDANNNLTATVSTHTGETALAGSPAASNEINILSTGTGTNANYKNFSSANNVGVGVINSQNKLSVNAPVTADTLATTIITPTVASNKGLVVQGYTSQTADLIQAQSSLGAVLFKIDNSGNLAAKSATFTGTLTMNGHIITGNSIGSTTIAAGANAGTGATATISGNDTSGTITVTTGTGPAAGTLATITFAGTYGSAPRVVLTPTGANGATLQYYVGSTTTTFTLSSGTAPTASTAYTYNYQVMQ